MVESFNITEAVITLGKSVVDSDIKRGRATKSHLQQWRSLSNQIISYLERNSIDNALNWRAIVHLQSICLTGLSFMSGPAYDVDLQGLFREYFVQLSLELMDIERNLIDSRFDDVETTRPPK